MSLKPIPHFRSEDEEREFWAKHDSSNYIDWSKAVRNPAFLRPKLSSRTKQRNEQAHEHTRKPR